MGSHDGNVIITHELDRRPSRDPDYAAENNALTALAEAMSKDPDTVLQQLVELAMALTNAQSAGISLLEAGGENAVFRWIVTAGVWSSHSNGTIAANASPCGEVVARNTVLLMKNPERAYPAMMGAVPGISESLLAPFYLEGVAVGTLWVVKHDHGLQFVAEDARILTSLAPFASAAQRILKALQMAHAASQQAEDSVQQLVALADISMEFFGTCDMDFMLIYSNAAAMRMVGLADLEQVKRTPVYELFFPEDRRFIVDEFFPRVLKNGHGSIETRFRHFETGEPVWVIYSLVALKDATGRPTGFGSVTQDITQRKRTEAALCDSEVRERAIFDASPTPFLVMEPNTPHFTVSRVNDAYLAATMTKRENIVGRGIFELFPDNVPDPTDHALISVRASLERVLCTRGADQLPDLKYDIMSVDGAAEERWWRLVNSPVLNECGEVEAIIHFATDITDQRLTEQHLRTSEVRYRRLFEAAHDGVLILDPDTQKIIDANPFMTNLLGYSHDELVGKELYQIGFLGEAQASRDMFQTLKATRQVRYEDLPLQSDQGTTRKVEVVANLYDEDGKTVVQCNVRDISERRRAERALHEVEERQKLVLEACRIGTFHGNLETGEAVWNSVEFKLLGLEAGDAPAEMATFFRHVHPDDLAALQSDWAKGTEPGGRESEFRIIRADGEERWLVVRGVILPYDDAAGAGQDKRFLGVNFDITERKRAEEHAEVLVAEVNHRARNLLSVVQAVAQQTAKLGDPQSFAARLSDRINGLAANQDLLVKNLWRGVEVTELVVAQLAHFKDIVGKRIHLHGPDLTLTAAASQAIGMALHELSTNAAKYGALSNGAGEVHIAWEASADPMPIFSMSWVESGGPPVTPPKRKGFGQTVTKRLVEVAVGGAVEIGYAAAGFTWHLQTQAANALIPSSEAINLDAGVR